MKCVKNGAQVELEQNCFYTLCGGWKIQCPATNLFVKTKRCKRRKDAWVPEITVCGLSEPTSTLDIINLIFLATHDNKLVVTNNGDYILVHE